MSELERRALLGVAGMAGIAALAKLAEAGPLSPPAGAVGPTGTTLDAISARIARGAAGIAEPRIPLSTSSSLTITTPGSYYLTENLLAAVVIQCDNVTLDLCGYSISTVPAFSLLNIRGNNVTVRNGRLTETAFGTNGIFIGTTSNPSTYRNILLEDLDIHVINSCVFCYSDNNTRYSDNVTLRRVRLRSELSAVFSSLGLLGPGSAVIDCVAGDARTGLSLGERSIVMNSRFANFSTAYGLEVGDGSLVVDTSVDSATTEGISAGAASSVRRCTVTRCGTGISAGARATVSECTIDACASAGVRGAQRLRLERSAVQGTFAGPGVKVDSFDAAIVDCSINLNSGFGIDLGGPAVIDRCHLANNTGGGIRTDMLTRISNCHLDFNAAAGITATSTGTGGVDIRDCTITRHATGVSLALGTGNAITRCMFSGNNTPVSAPAGVVAPSVSAAAANTATNPLVNLLI